MFIFPPSLTEQWASAYFQILIGVFIFALGIPAIEFQLVVEEDIRHIVVRRRTGLRGWKFIVLMLFLVSLSFVWFLHPGVPINKVSDSDVPPAASPTPVKVAEQNAGNIKDGGPVVASPQPSATPAPAPEPSLLMQLYMSEKVQSIVAASLVSLTFVLAVIYGLRLPTKYSRVNVIAHLRDKLIKSFNEDGHLDEDVIDDLSYLGEHGKPGDEKQLVLDAFKSVTYEVLDSPKYSGTELKEILLSFKEIVSGKDKPGNDTNYASASVLLTHVWKKISENESRLSSDNDARHAAQMLSALGIEAVKNMSQQTALTFVENAGQCDDKIVFEIGLAALRVKQFRVASGALSKLKWMAKSENQLQLTPSDMTLNLLGLLAHFIHYGDATKELAESFLSGKDISFSPSLEACINAAIYYHYFDSNFDTVNYLIKLLPDANGSFAERQPNGLS